MTVTVRPESYEAIANLEGNDLQPWIDVQPAERLEMALIRSLRSLDTLDEHPEVGTPLWEEMMERYYNELRQMATSDLLTGMAEKGLIATNGVGDDGSLAWVATPLGAALYEQEMSA